MTYINHTAEELAADESFQDYYLYHQKEAMMYWQEWIKAHPNKRTEIEAAKTLLDLFQVAISDQTVKTAFAELQQTIHAKSTDFPPITKNIRRRKFLKLASSVAAILAILTIFSANYFLSQKSNIDFTTTSTLFGELKKITLPDGSFVHLNSNSTLKYNKDWPNDQSREVWLEGEAFFEVTPTPNKGTAAFIVHSNDTDVKVLGTSFNVYNRNNKIAVVLETGKVNVHYNKTLVQSLLPKEAFEINAQRKTRHYQNINTSLYTAWKESNLVLQDTPLKKVVSILEDNFGFEVVLKNQTILDRKLTATIPIKDTNLLLEALREIYGLKITKTAQKILIE